MTKDQLHAIGRALYGTHWQTQIANAITNLNSDALDVRRVQQWACGARPVPVWLLPELKTLAQKRMQEIQEVNEDLLAM
jgi:hypothetical protein